jgi:hypothetical protein
MHFRDEVVAEGSIYILLRMAVIGNTSCYLFQNTNVLSTVVRPRSLT